jgi:HEAT repeat protein
MIIGEAILSAIVDAVIAYTFERGTDKLGIRVRERLGLDPTKTAFKEALNKAFIQLSDQRPQWVSEYFDASFFEHEGAPILAQFLVLDGQPDPGDLALRWADSLNIKNPERRAFYIGELEPIAVDFLEDLAHQLKGQEALHELNLGRSLEQTTEVLQALRRQLGADKATFGTRRDYLRWLIGRNFYLDPRGTFQTQRQVQVKLDEVYISLQAQPSEIQDAVDRQDLEQELADLEMNVVVANLAAEELEDQRDQLRSRLKQTSLAVIKQAEVVALAEVVIRNDRVVILGDPGGGKTTLLRYLALKHAEALWSGRTEVGKDLGTARFPILIRIAEYADDGIWKRKSLSDFLVDCYTMHDCPRTGLADLLQSELDKGNCLVMLDGLDEIISAEERLGVVKQVEDFVRRYSSKANRFVITSRIAGYRNAPLGEPFTHYTVREMNEAQIRRFLERWCQAVEDAQTPELSVQQREQIARREIIGIMHALQNPGVRRLAVNPLLLRILALIHRTGAQLPQKRIELYKFAADTLARTWRPAQGVSESDLVKESALLKEDYLTPLLSKLAYWLHVNKPTGIATEREVYEVLGEEWSRLNEMHWNSDDPSPKIKEEVRKFIAAVHEHTGLFVERAPKRYGFIHLTFEEYYVARYIVARRKMVAKLIRQHLHQPRWEEPILLALGFVGLEYPAEASELVVAAILGEGDEAKELGFTSSKYEDLLGQDFLFSLHCLGDNIPIRPRLLKRLIERFADELLNNTGSARFRRYRQNLQEKLNYFGGSEGASVILPLLVKALRSPEIDVRSQGALSLGQMGQSSPEAIHALIAALQDPEVGVRSVAASGLGQLGQSSPEAIHALIAALQDPEAGVRSQAASGLSRLGQNSPEAIHALITALQDPEAGMRSQAASGLSRLGQNSPEAIHALITACQDPEVDVRSQAASGLSRLGQNSPKAIHALITALQDPEVDVRHSAIVSLGQLGRDTLETNVEIYTVLRKANNWVLRRDSAHLLNRIDPDDTVSIDALWDGLLDEDNNVREACAQSLAELGKRHATLTQDFETKFIRAIQDPRYEKPGTIVGLQPFDFAYEGLWLLVVNAKVEKK